MKNTKYYLPKERYYELVHFCRQYDIWSNAYAHLDNMSLYGALSHEAIKDVGNISDPTAKIAEAKAFYSSRMEMLDTASAKCSQDAKIQELVFKGATKGFSYDYMSIFNDMPCSRSEYYKAYKKFFQELDKLRR